MSSDDSRTVWRSDYQPWAHRVESVSLSFELDAETTLVSAALQLRRIASGDAPLTLYGHDLELLSLSVDSQPLATSAYRLDGEVLTIPDLPESFLLTVVTAIHPAANTALEGLYLSGGRLCTQCEAEGFRRITFYPDRPDVLAAFDVTLIADRKRFPVLLCNGNPVEARDLDDGRHLVRWHDPYPKPSYLFALVAGDLSACTDTFVTRSGRTVDLHIYVEAKDLDKCAHAMQSLKDAMRWDEAVFNLEYDLDIYMIVAVDDFNMGAMENKGLNIFNSRYVLARPETATDADYQAIREVIGHEYFHNWTGNRVTCRDWFQLSLKEGLTVFRDQQFSADHGSAAVKRIQDVRTLRAGQFPEDSGPMAHPVRPESYQEINNFYTATVYNKGAEVIRMYHTLLGEERFNAGLSLYLQRHDGEAATIDDFLAAMADASGRDLSLFSRWYSQAGTPQLFVSRRYDAATQHLDLTLRQEVPVTPGQLRKEPMLIPFAFGLIGTDGREVPIRFADEAASTAGTRIVELHDKEQTLRLLDVPAGTAPSLLRGFSAPVQLHDDLTLAERALLLAADPDPFCCWEAGQKLFTGLIFDAVAGSAEVPSLAAEAFARLLRDDRQDPALIALALTLPSVTILAELQTPADPPALHAAREAVRTALARPLHHDLERLAATGSADHPYLPDGPGVGRRSLKNLSLGLLALIDAEGAARLCQQQLQNADNMTDALAALTILVDRQLAGAEAALQNFYRRWRHEGLVIDKWFTLQATAGHSRVFADVQLLLQHADFNPRNPNRVRSLLGAFAQGNPGRFHRHDGAAYFLLAGQIADLDQSNPQLAARLAAPLSRWQNLSAPYDRLMRAALHELSQSDLSRDLHEIVSKSLGGTP